MTKFFFFVLFPLSCGVDVRWRTPPCSTLVHLITHQPTVPSIWYHRSRCPPFSLRSSSLHFSWYFNFLCPRPTYRPSAHSLLITCPYHFNLLSWTSFAISPTFAVRLILSFLILSSFVILHIHRNILISATSNLFSSAFFKAHVSAPYISAGLTTVLKTFPLVFTFISLSHHD